jgi:hypothetical protein
MRTHFQTWSLIVILIGSLSCGKRDGDGNGNHPTTCENCAVTDQIDVSYIVQCNSPNGLHKTYVVAGSKDQAIDRGLKQCKCDLTANCPLSEYSQRYLLAWRSPEFGKWASVFAAGHQTIDNYKSRVTDGTNAHLPEVPAYRFAASDHSLGVFLQSYNLGRNNGYPEILAATFAAGVQTFPYSILG